MILEIKNFITRAEHKIADLASSLVDADGDINCLRLLLDLSEAVDYLNNCHYKLSEVDQLKIAHYWSKEANLTNSIFLDLPGFKTLGSVIYSTVVSTDGSVIGGESTDWTNITNKPLSFSSSIPLVEGLTTALAFKANINDVYYKLEIDNKFSSLVSGLKWKNNVPTVADLTTTYPNAIDGFAAIVDSDKLIYRFDGTTNTWGSIGGAMYPKASSEVDGLMSKEDKVKLDGLNGDVPKYTINIPVSLSGGKTLGKYVTGQTASYTDKTLVEILKDLAQESINPTVGISTNLDQREYNKTDINVSISMSYSINTLGATLVSHKLERTRDGVTWVTLYDSASFLTAYSDAGLNATVDNRTITYRSIVTDSAGASASSTTAISFKAYVTPSVSNLSVGSTNRVKGDNSVTVSGTIVRNSPHIALVSYKVQYKLATGDWVNIINQAVTDAATVSFSHVHNDTATKESDFVLYRVLVTDAQTIDHPAAQTTINYLYNSYLGYSVTPITTVAQIEALGNASLTNEKERTIAGVTSTGGTKTYYAYKSTDGDLTSIIMDGSAPVLGAFTKKANITGVNSLGATVTYTIYESNSTNAFTNNTLAFS